MTLVQTLYDQIRLDILSGKIEPGSKLRFSKLKEDYSASMGVLREVLSLLSGQGLVTNLSQQGFKAMALTMDDLRDLTDTRCYVEVMVLRDSIENGSIDWETRVVAAHHKLSRTPKEDLKKGIAVTENWSAAHQGFHEALTSASKRTRLNHFSSGLRDAAEVYRQWSMVFEVEKRDVAAEHEELMQLSIARDADGACRALEAHLRATSDLILSGTALNSEADL